MASCSFDFNKVNVKNFSGHRDEVNCAVLSADLEMMVTGSDDCRLRLFNTVTGNFVTSLCGHTGAITTVAISPNSRYIASASYDKTVRVWMTRTAECLHVLTDHAKNSECLAFSHDSLLLCSGSWDKTAILWTVQDGEHVITLNGHRGLVQSAAFSYNGHYLATGSWDYSVCVWSVKGVAADRSNVNNVSLLHSMTGHTGNVRAVAFSREGMLASGSWDKTVRLWSPLNGRCLFVLEGHGGWVQAIAFSSDSMHLVSAGDHDVLRIWDCTNGSSVQTLDMGDTETASQCVFGPKGIILTSGCGTVRTASNKTEDVQTSSS